MQGRERGRGGRGRGGRGRGGRGRGGRGGYGNHWSGGDNSFDNNESAVDAAESEKDHHNVRSVLIN